MPLFKKARQPSGAIPRATPAVAPTPAFRPAGPPIDRLLADPAAHRFTAELAEGRWQEFHDFLVATTDPDDRCFYVTELAKIDGRPDWLDDWVAARPQSPLPLLFRGTHYTHWAWQARGSGYAKTVAECGWDLFHQRLVTGDGDLARAAAMDESDPAPHARSIWTAIGLSLGQQEIRQRFAEVTRRNRWDRFAHQSMIQALAAKWHGSHEEMFEFARAESAQAPEGSSAHRGIALAHLERWGNIHREFEDGREREQVYFFDDAVQAEIRRAAGLSVRSPRYSEGKFEAVDRNTFAMCFWLMRDYEAQLEQMDLIGPLNQTAPWHIQGEARWAYERARTTALKAAGRDATEPAPPTP
jgi:hypothetical protein